MADETFPRTIERLVEDVVDFAEQYIDEITKALAPDGVGFGQRKMTKQEQIAEYARLRGNVEEWSKWIGSRAGELAARAEAMLPPDRAAQVKPWDIAARLAIQYAAKMEREYIKAQKRNLDRLVEVVDDGEEVTGDDAAV